MTGPRIFPASRLCDDQLQTVLAAWHLIKGEAHLPAHPADILRYLTTSMSKLVLMDVERGGMEFRFRLVGESVFPAVLELQVSRSVSEHPDDNVRLTYTSLLKVVYGAGEPIGALTPVMTIQDRRNVEIESLWLPFGRGNKVEQILSMSAEPHIITRENNSEKGKTHDES